MVTDKRCISTHSPWNTHDLILLLIKGSKFLVAAQTRSHIIPEWINVHPAIFNDFFTQGAVNSDIDQLSSLPDDFVNILRTSSFHHVAFVPLQHGGVLKAILVVGSRIESPISNETLPMLSSLGEFTLSAIESSIKGQGQKEDIRELDVLTRTSQAIASVTSLESLYDVLHEQVRMKMGTIDFLVALYEAGTNAISVPYMYESLSETDNQSIESFPLGEGLISVLIQTKQPLMIIEDTERRAAALGAKVVGKPAKSWLGVPLLVGENVIGAIVIQDLDHENAFSETDLLFLSALSSQASRTIFNIRLLEETRNRALQLQTAAEIARDISISLDIGELLTKAVTLIRERFNFYHAAVFLKDITGEYAIVREATGEAGVQMKHTGHKLKVGSKSIIGHVTASGEPLVVNDTGRDATYFPNPLLPDTHSEIGIPLKIGQRILGALDVQSTEIFAFNSEDINVLQILADQLAIAVINSELFSETQEHLSQHRLLHHVTTAAASGTTLPEALNSAAQGLQVTLGGDRVAILLADRVRKILKVEAIAGYSEEIKNVEIKFGEGITGWVAAHQQPLRIDDVSRDERYIEIGSNVSSELAIPLAYRGEILGVLNVESDQIGAYDENDEELLGTLGGSLAAIIANARLLEQIRHQVDRERLMYEITTKIRRSTDMQTIMSITANELSKAFGANRAEIKIDMSEQPLPEKDQTTGNKSSNE